MKERKEPMHIGQIIRDDVANGPGIRLSVFVSGCRIHCKGCFQPQTWNFCFGTPYTEGLRTEILDELGNPQYDGITILGGEPFEPENQPYVLDLLQQVYSRFSDRDVWIYSGCDIHELLDPASSHHTEDTLEILNLADVLVAGPFVESLRNISLPYCGSENQQVIDLHRSRLSQYRDIVLWDDSSARM